MAASTIGLVAGSDELPLVFARCARDSGEKVVAVGVTGYTERRLAAVVSRMHWVGPGELGRVPGLLRDDGVERAVLVGRIPQEIVFAGIEFDDTTRELLASVEHRQTDALLRSVGQVLERTGLELVDARPYLGEMVPGKGVLTARAPDEREQGDIEFGSRIAREVGRLDIGQTVVVKERVVLAVEAIEGTDEAVRRGAALAPGGGAVVVKTAKPNQDLRFDLPVVGIRTVEVLREAGVSVLALEAGKTVMLNREQVVREADAAGIAITAV